MISRLGELEKLDCNCMVFPPSSVSIGGLSAVRAFFSSDLFDIDLKGAGVGPEEVSGLGDALQTVTVRSIDLSGNEALGTSGVCRLVSCCAGEQIVFVGLLHFVCFDIVTFVGQGGCGG